MSQPPDPSYDGVEWVASPPPWPHDGPGWGVPPPPVAGVGLPAWQPWGTTPPAPSPAPGIGFAAPAARPFRQQRQRAVLVVGGIVLGVAVMALVVGAGFGMGRTAGAELAEQMAAGMVLPPPDPSLPADPAGLGDDPGLDTYAQRCHAGEMDACDDLYALSDVLSDYERYGMTCGGRVKPFEVMLCTDLD